MSTTTNVHLDSASSVRTIDYGTHTSVVIRDGTVDMNIWMGIDDETAVANADKVIEALHELRVRCLARIVKSEPEQADPITLAKAAVDAETALFR